MIFFSFAVEIPVNSIFMEINKEKIGKRIALARKEAGLFQKDLAERLHISRSRLASYEEGHGCLRCGIAFNICRNLIISEKWLATGQGEKDLYMNISSLFPEELKGKPLIDLYASDIALLYEEEKTARNGEIAFGWRLGDNPATHKLACFKLAALYSRHITDDRSLMLFWSQLADSARVLGETYSVPPRERLAYLNTQLTVLKNGEEAPFSYGLLFDDLSVIGVHWTEIEALANAISLELGSAEGLLDVEDLKKHIYTHLKKIERDIGGNYSKLYKKIYLSEK